MRIAGIEYDDIANGAGIGVALFVQGCDHHCKGCHNPATWDFSCGKEFKESNLDDIVNYFEQNPFATRLTITGGDPLHDMNIIGVFEFILRFKRKLPNIAIWIYSGYTWEQVLEQYATGSQRRAHVISVCNVFVDGEFDIEKRDVTLQFRGSSNQRVIDVRKTVVANKVILWGE